MKIGRKTATACVAAILLLYVSAIIFAFMDSPIARELLLTALFLTVVIPAFLYGLVILLRMRKRHLENDLEHLSGTETREEDAE